MKQATLLPKVSARVDPLESSGRPSDGEILVAAIIGAVINRSE
jgi:hypothetical protein